MSSRLHACFTLGATLALLGCERLLDAPDYRLELEEGASRGRQLIELFAGASSEACRACLELGTCGEHFAECGASQSCSALAACLVDEPSPASEAWCVSRLNPSEGDRASALALSDCYRGCVVECGAGRDFSCADNYSWPPSVPNSTVVLTQQLSLLQGAEDAAVTGATVTICPPGPNCAQPLMVDGEPLVATTDETGTYSVRIPIATAPASVAGFRGFRVVEGEAIVTHRLQSNVRLLVDHVQRTKLLRKEEAELIFSFFGIGETIDALALQMFDCRGVGAGDVFFDFPDSPEAVVHYKDDVSPVSVHDDGTLASQEGAALVTGLTAGRVPHRVLARTRDGQTVGEADVFVSGDEFSVINLYPRGKSR